MTKPGPKKLSLPWLKELSIMAIAGIIAGVAVLAIASVLAIGGTGPASDQPRLTTASRNRAPTHIASKSLNVTFRQVPTAFFAVALRTDIGIPKASEQWAQLHARGGIDARHSRFDVTITNPTEAPITITNVEALVERTEPAVRT